MGVHVEIEPGTRKNSLVCLGEAGVDKRGNRLHLLRCDCGKKFTMPTTRFVNHCPQTCGCLRVNMFVARNISHGMSGTKLYRVWINMRKRCYEPSTSYYKNYGGRGIEVCERWRDSFENFYEDMGSDYKPGFSLDRINNDGNYSPENCRWATKEQQDNNKRSNRYIVTDRGKKTMSQLSKETGISYRTIESRLNRGYPLEYVLYKGNLLTCSVDTPVGSMKVLTAAKRYKIKPVEIFQGIAKGMSTEAIFCREESEEDYQ